MHFILTQAVKSANKRLPCPCNDKFIFEGEPISAIAQKQMFDRFSNISQMNNIGYTIVELPSLERWLSSVNNSSMLVALCTWLTHRLSQALHDDYPSLIIEVIRVDYLGAYPALGLRDERNSDNLPERINDLAERILSSSSISDFLDFAFKDNIDWEAKAKTLLGL